MIDTFTLPFSMCHLFWMLTVGHMSKVLTVNGWHVRSLPFKGISRNLLQSLGPFAMLPDKAGLISLLVPLLTTILITTTLMKSQVHTPFETTFSNSCALDAVILGTGQDHVLHSIKANLHVSSSQDGRTTNSYQSKLGSRSDSHTMSVHPVVTTTTLCMASTSVLSVQTPNMQPLGAPETDLSEILYKVITLYILAAWNQALSDMNLINLYPNLIHNLTVSSPIGNPPPINFTFIPDNLPPRFDLNIL